MRVHVAALRDASACRVALGYEDARLFLAVILRVAVVDPAVAQLAIVEVGLLGALTRQLGNAGHGLALVLALLYLVFQHVGYILFVNVQIVVDLALHEVADILVYGLATGFHERGAELDFCLRLKHRLFHVDGDGRHYAVANVGVLIVLVVVFLDGLGYMLLERALVGAALRGVLAIDKAVVFLTILVGMGEGNLYVLALEVDDGVQRVCRHGVDKQVLKAVAALDAPAVIHYGKPAVKVSVVAEHGLHELIVERIVLEERIVRLKEYVRAVLVMRRLRLVALELAFLKHESASR